jgi:hypothetical protein
MSPVILYPEDGGRIFLRRGGTYLPRYTVSTQHATICSNLRFHCYLWLVHLQLRRRWENNIKMDIKEVGCTGVDRIYMPQDESGVIC